jgi:hypothetical protein
LGHFQKHLRGDTIRNKTCYFFEVISSSVTLLCNNLLHVAPEVIENQDYEMANQVQEEQATHIQGKPD